MRILIAEDEESIAKALKVMLNRERYSTDVVFNGNDALDYIKQNTYDALVLDIMMPGLDGIKVLKQIRQLGIKTPTLFLSAKAEVSDKVAGLDAGADDYLPKPFQTAEFLARVRALVRRSCNYEESLLSFGNTTLDKNQYLLKTKESEIRLNNKEYQLMEVFFRNPKNVFSSEHLMDTIWCDSDTSIDVVWTYIGFLRKKLKQINSNIEIQTVRGAGYALEKKHVKEN